jgi:hypothetical protein
MRKKKTKRATRVIVQYEADGRITAVAVAVAGTPQKGIVGIRPHSTRKIIELEDIDVRDLESKECFNYIIDLIENYRVNVQSEKHSLVKKAAPQTRM